MSWLVTGLIGLFAGVMGGLLGVGGGVVMVPAFMGLLDAPAHRATATSMAVIFFTAFTTSIQNHRLGKIDWWIVLPVALLSMIGGPLGTTLASRLPEKTLRMIFAGFLLLMALDMFQRAWRLPSAS